MKRSQIILGILLLAIVVGGAGTYWWFSRQVGTVTLQLSSTPKNLAITFNGTLLEEHSKNGSTYTFIVHKNNYRLTVTAPGYKPFGANLQVNTGAEYQVAAQLQFLHDPTITSGAQVSGLGGNATISRVEYLYGQTWAVLTLGIANSDPSYAAVQYDPVANNWALRAGPGTYFTPGSVAGLPSQVISGLTGGR